MKAIKLMSVVFLVAAMFTSCKKKNCDLTSGNLKGVYKIASVKYKASSTSTEIEVLNNQSYFDPCDRDNTITFNANGTYDVRDAGIFCSGNLANEVIDSGVWAVNGNILSIDGTDTNVPDFNCNSITIVEEDVSGEKWTYTYSKQ